MNKQIAYKHLFFDLDHTIWDFEANSKLALLEMYHQLNLQKLGVTDFDLFFNHYLVHNEKLWAHYRKGYIKQEVLRTKRMALSLLDFKIVNDTIAKKMGEFFLEKLPLQKLLFDNTLSTLNYLIEKKYILHIITNGFQKIQIAKLKNSSLENFFTKIITSEESQYLKPDIKIFEYALKVAGAQKAESIMLGDNIEVDILGAKAAGIDQVFINHSNIQTKVIATYTVNNLEELQNIF